MSFFNRSDKEDLLDRYFEDRPMAFSHADEREELSRKLTSLEEKGVDILEMTKDQLRELGPCLPKELALEFAEWLQNVFS